MTKSNKVDHFGEYFTEVLPNGLTVILAPMDTRSVTGLVLVGAGSRYEKKATNGLSHFLEHMFFKGTKKRPTALAVASEIDGLGGVNNAFTSKEYTGYYIKAGAAHLDNVLEIIADMLYNSTFRNEEFERERNVILQEIHMRYDDPKIHVLDLTEEIVFGLDQPLGWDTAGYPAIIRKQTRNQMLDYIASFYHPNNMVVVVAGGFKREAALEMAKKYYANAPEKEFDKPLPYLDKQESMQISLNKRRVTQSAIALAVKGVSYFDEDRYALETLTAILGGGMSSRMFSEVREKRGLAYYVRSGCEFYRDSGVFFTYAGIDLPKVKEAVGVMTAEYAKIRDVAVGEKELSKAKESLKGHMALAFEDSLSVASSYGLGQLLENRVRTLDEEMAEIDKVTAKDVRTIAGRIFQKEKLSFVAIGPFADRAEFEPLLNL